MRWIEAIGVVAIQATAGYVAVLVLAAPFSSTAARSGVLLLGLGLVSVAVRHITLLFME